MLYDAWVKDVWVGQLWQDTLRAVLDGVRLLLVTTPVEVSLDDRCACDWNYRDCAHPVPVVSQVIAFERRLS